MTAKRFTLEEFGLNFIVNDNGRNLTARKTVDLLNELHEENTLLRQELKKLKESITINCSNCEYFVSDSASSDCLKREDIGYKGIGIDGLDLHRLAKNCRYYSY